MKKLKYVIISCLFGLLTACSPVEASVPVTTPNLEATIQELENTTSSEEEVDNEEMLDEARKVYSDKEAKDYLNNCLNTDTAVFKYYDNTSDKEYVYYLSESDIDNLTNLLIHSNVDTTKNSLNADFTYTVHMYDREGNYVYVVSVDKDEKTTYYEPGLIDNNDLTHYIMSFKEKSTVVGLTDGLDIHNLVNSFSNKEVENIFYDAFSSLLLGQYRNKDVVLDLSPIEVNMVKSVISDLRTEPYNADVQKEYLEAIQRADRCIILADETNESANVGYMLWVYSIPNSEYYYLEFDNLSITDETAKRYVFRFTDSKGRLNNTFSKFEMEKSE